MSNNNDIRKEMEQLRHQLDTLKQAQQESDSDTAAQDNSTHTEVLEISTAANNAADVNTENAGESDLAGQFQELMEVLDKEIKDSDPITMLVVFSLGVLVGRLLPR
ncbi:MAG: hypothetical protein GQ529_06820 [Methyloprofundus sp.]|nr:hypothetical protein [Methyloprofundus sp.]